MHAGFFAKYIELSCAPNVSSTTCNGYENFIAIRPIAKGEFLTIAKNWRVNDLPKEKRQQILWERFQFICECVRCEGATASLEQRQRMILDSNFQYITSNQCIPTGFIGQTIQTMIKKCQQFLQTYGKIVWCDELAIVVRIYLQCLHYRNRSVGNTILP